MSSFVLLLILLFYQITTLRGKEVVLGPVLYNTTGSDVSNENITNKPLYYKLIVQEIRQGIAWVKLVNPEVKLKCRLTSNLSSISGTDRTSCSCSGAFQTSGKKFHIQRKFNHKNYTGSITLHMELDLYDTSRYAIEMSEQNSTRHQCPTNSSLEIIVTKYEDEVTLATKIAAITSAAVAAVAIAVAAVKMWSSRSGLDEQHDTSHELSLNNIDSTDKERATADSTAQILSVNEAYLWTKYRQRLQLGKRIAMRRHTKMKSLQSADPIFTSKYRLSSLQGSSIHWTILKLAVTGEE